MARMFDNDVQGWQGFLAMMIKDGKEVWQQMIGTAGLFGKKGQRCQGCLARMIKDVWQEWERMARMSGNKR